jgi:uncharacterized cupin superfamily protein
MEFKYTRLYADTQGESRFEENTIPMRSAGTIGFLSELFTVEGIIFREVEPTYDYDFHNAPQRQFLVLLDGEIEIETSLGEKRTFRAGDVLLLEDVTGKGHRTRNVLQEPRRSLFIPVGSS